MRYLFVTVDSGGALYPQLALAQRVRVRGHEVRFLACRSQREAIAQEGFRLQTYSGQPDFDMADPNGPIKDWLDDPEITFKACCNLIWFGPAAALAADVIDEVQREPVDVLVIDYFAFGAAIAGEHLGLQTVILWHTTFGEWPSFNLGLPALNAARGGLGLPDVRDVYDAYHRAKRILVLTTERFDSALGDHVLPSNLRHVGPQFPPSHEPRAALPTRDKTPSVLVSLSTSYQAQEDLLLRVVSALADLPVNALVTTGPAIQINRASPPNVQILPWIAHTEVLPRTDLVVTHAGLGTVMTTMAFGVPLLCLPMGRDQHGNAARVEQLGFGLTVDSAAGIPELQESIRTGLADDSLRARAQVLAEECRQGDGYDTGALELEAAVAVDDR